jgi:hypothetical protein
LNSGLLLTHGQVHAPQSAGHETQVSSLPQLLFGQLAQAPQSCAQVPQFSAPLHSPSGHMGPQAPQSPGQFWQVSNPLQIVSPQTSPPQPSVQSCGQVAHDSWASQTSSPQPGQTPQSCAQPMQSSLPLHIVSPQNEHTSQSAGQLWHDSVMGSQT